MKLKKMKWKLALPILMLSLLAGCGEGQEANNVSGTSIDKSLSSIQANEKSSQELKSQEPSKPRTEIDILMEIQDPEERYEEAKKLIEPRLSSIKENFDDNLKILRIMGECKSDYALLSDQELQDYKKQVLEKLELYHGKSAILYLGCWDFEYKRDGSTINQIPIDPSYTIFDNKDRLIYKNNNKNFDSSNIYEEYSPNHYTTVSLYARDFYVQYDDNDRKESITLCFTGDSGNVERIDRAEYDSHGNAIQIYQNEIVTDKYEYNENGECVKSQHKRFFPSSGHEMIDTVLGQRNLNDEWCVCEYQYRKDGYLSKKTTRYYDYWEDKNVTDVTNYDKESKVKVKTIDDCNLNLKDQLGKRICVQNGLKIALINTYFMACHMAAPIEVYECNEEQPETISENDFDALDDMFEILPSYYYDHDRVLMVGVVKDCGDDFVEYLQYEVQYTPSGEIRVVYCSGHAIYYLPELITKK